MKIFDAHFHIIDSDFPVVENNGYTPPEFTVSDYQKVMSQYGITGGAIVSGSFQAFDQTYLTYALDKLGEHFFGVANIPHTISDKELDFLNSKRIRAVRFNLKRGGSETLNHLEYLSNKLLDQYGWHTEFYLDSKGLKDLATCLRTVRSFSIDHLGLSKAGLPELYKWVEKGIKVKATGFGRTDFDCLQVIKQVYSINPEALMFGTDLPSTRAPIPFSESDIDLIRGNFDVTAQHKILFENAMEWYSRK